MRFSCLPFLCLSLAVSSVQAASMSPAEYLRLHLEAQAKVAAGDRAAALPLLERMHAATPDDGALKLELARALYAAGRSEEAMPLLLESMDAGFANEARSAYALARVTAAAGDTAAALSWLERAMDAGMEDVADMKRDESFEALRGNPRFREMAGIAPAGIADRVAGWNHDLDFYVRECQRQHASPDRPAFSEDFLRAVDELRGKVASLTDAAVATELQRVTATWLADGHSAVYPIPTERVQFSGMLPVTFYEFADGWYVVGADPPHAELIGMRVEKIGNQSADGLMDVMRGIVSHDNEQGIRWIGPLYLRSTDLLVAMGCIESPASAELTLSDPSGTSRVVTLEPAPPRELHEKLGAPPDRDAPPWLARNAENYWYRTMPELDAAYIQFNQVRHAEDGPSIEALAREVRDALREHGAHNLIIDVRHNNGGNNFLHWPITRLVMWHGMENEGNRTFVITSRTTFSAAQNFINFLEREAQPIFVGEPSASRPNFTGESNRVELPWSGLQMSISSRWWQDSYPGDDRPYIPVAMPVDLTFEDWWSGRDPVMDALHEFLGKD